MTKILPMLLLAACAQPPVESTVAADLSKDDLTKQGYDCTLEDTPYGYSVWWCTKCDSSGNCTAYFCKEGESSCDDSFTISYIGGNTYDHDLNYWFEGEAATLTAPMQKLTSSSASSGSFIAVPTTAGAGGSARFTFTAPYDATAMHVWARVIAPSTSSNGVTFAVDGKSAHWELPVTTSWTWVELPAVTWSVPAGAHTLVITRDEADVRIDRVLLTASSTFAPSVRTIEGESAALVAPMQVGGSLLTTRYVYAPVGSTGGLADYDAASTQGGYAVWGLVSAATSATNSFRISANFGPKSTWDLPVTGTAWAWSKAPPALQLGPTSFLRIEPLEAGAKLDKLIITNDPGFTPVVQTLVNALN